MGFLNNAKVVSNTDTSNLKPLQGAKVILPNNTSTQPVEEKSALDTFGKIVDVIATPIDSWIRPLAEFIVNKTSKPDNIDINKAKSTLDNITITKPSLSDEEYSNKLFNSIKNTIRSQTGAQEEVVDFQSIEFLKNIGLEPITKKNQKGEDYISFNDINKQFTDQEKQSIYKEVDNIALTYNKQIKELQDLKAEAQFFFQGVGKYVPFIDQLKTEQQINLEKSFNSRIEELEKEKNLLISTIKDKIGVTKSEARKVNPETGIIATQPLETIDFQNIDKIDPNEISQTIGLANYDLEERIKGLKAANNPLTSVDTLGRSLVFMDYVNTGLELTYGANPEVLKRKKDLLADVPFKNDQRPSIEQQEAAFIAIKQEQKDLLSSIEQNEQAKLSIDEQLNKFTIAYKQGTKLTPEQEVIFNNLSITSSLLEKNIKLQKDNVKSLQSFIDSTTPAYKGFLEEQFKYDRIADIAPITTSIYEGLESLALIPQRIGKFGIDVAEVSGLSTSNIREYANLKTSPEFRYDVDGELRPIKEIEAIKLVDENGEFNFDVHVPALFYNTVKVSGESFVLGLGMLGTRALVASTIEKNLAKWATGEAASEIGISQILPTNPLSTPFRQLGREFTKAAIMGTGSEAAFLSPLYVAESFVGSAVPSAFLFGDEMIQNQLDQNLPYKAAFATGTLLSFVEGFSERMFPNEMNFAKFLIQKGEIKTLKELTENSTYRKAIEETYKRITGKPLTEKLYKALTNTKEFTKAFLSTGGEESLEEIGGLFLQDKFVNPISRKYNPDYKGEEFTQEAIVNTTISTMATMLPMMGQAGYSAVKQYNAAQKSAQFIVGQNTTPYHEMNLSLFKEGAISEQEFQRRTQLIDKHKQNYNNALAQAITKSFTSNYTEDQFKNYTFEIFNKLSSIEELKKAVVDNPNDEKVFQILEKENQDLQILLEKGLFKTEEKRVENVKNSLSFYLSPKNIDTFSKKELENTIQKLKGYEQIEINNELKIAYGQKIEELSSKLEEVTKKEIESAKTPEQKAQENNQKQSITIQRPEGAFRIQFNTPYFLSYIEEFSTEGAKIKKRPLITVLQDNGDGTIQIASEGEVSTIPIEDLSNYKFTRKETVDKWKKDKSPEGFVFEHENDVFSYEFYKATDNRNKIVSGRIQYNPLNKSVEFVYKDKKGEIQEFTLSKSDLKNVTKGKLKFVRTLETDAEFNAKQVKIQENALKTDFEQLQNQRRWEFIKNFIAKKQEELKSTKELISKVEDQLLDTEIQLEELQKQLAQKEKLTTAKGKRRVDVQKLFDRLNTLQNSATELSNTLNQLEQQKEDLENQIEYTKQYEGVEFETEVSLVDQLIDDQFNLESQLEQVNDVISNLRNLVSGIENTIKRVANIVSNLISGFEKTYGKERLTSFDSEVIRELKEIDKLFSQEYPNLPTFLQKNPEYFKNLLRFNELLNENLDKIDLSEKQIEDLKKTIKANIDVAKKIQDKIRFQEELIAFAQQEQIKFQEQKSTKKLQTLANQIFNSQKETQTENNVNDNEEDEKLVEQESPKIDLTEFFATTTSGVSEGGNFNLDNPQVLRLQNFLNTVEDPSIYSLLVITKDNAKQYGLESILYSDENTTNKTDDEKDNDIKLVVVVKDDTGKIYFVNQQGTPTESLPASEMVFTSLRKAKLTWSNGEKAYHVKNLNEKQEEELAKKLEENHKEFRQEIIKTAKNGNPITFGIKYISRGFQTQVGEPNSVMSVIPQGTDINNKQIVVIPTAETGKTSPVIYNGNKPIPMPVGRPVLSINQHFGFLNARQFSTKEAEKFAFIFKALYNAWKSGNQEQVKIIQKYLQKTLYFRNPENVSKLTNKKQTTDKGRSQIWFSNVNGIPYLHLSETFAIPFNFEEGNIDALTTVQAFFLGKDNKGVYHNVDNQALIGEPFVEITSVTKDGKITTRQWNSYQEYLISDKNPDGSNRPVEEIPLTINRNPSTITTPNMAGRYIIFENKSNNAVTNATKQAVISTPTQNISTPSVPITEDTEFDEKKSENQDITKLIPNKLYRYKRVVDGEEKFIDFTVDTKNNVKVLAHNFGLPIQQITISLETYTKGTKPKPPTSVLFELTPVTSKVVTQPALGEFSLLQYAKDLQTTPEEKQSTSPVEPTSQTNNEDWWKELNELNLPESGGSDVHYRKAVKTSYKLENLEEAKKWWEERFPQIPFNLAFGLIDGKAWGRIKNAILTLSDVAEEGTVYHEAFEVVYNYMLKPHQIKALHKEFKRRKGSFIDYETGKSVEYSKATDYQIKEQLAEEYREFELSGGKKKWEGEYNKNSLFRKIWEWIQSKLFTSSETIQEVFEKISNGAYKDNVISKTENINSNYKLSEIQLRNPVFFNDVMKSMTNLLFEVLASQNRSIPQIFLDNYDINTEQEIVKTKIDLFYGGKPIVDFINKFTKESFVKMFENQEARKVILEKFTKGTPALMQNLKDFAVKNKLSQQQFAEKLFDVLNNYTIIDKNWEELKENHKKYLAIYKIEFEDNSNELDEEVNSDENKDQNDYLRDVLKLSRKLNANTEIKLLIATLRQMEVVNKEDKFGLNNEITTKPVLNSLLMSSLVDYNKTIISLLYKLSPATNFDEMAEILKKEAVYNPSLQQLINKLKLNTAVSQLSEYDVDLRNKFYTSLNNLKVKYQKLILNPEDYSGNIFDLNEENAINIIKTKWFNNTRANTKLFPINPKTKEITINKSVLPVSTISKFDDAILFLNSLGYEFNFDYNRLSRAEKEEILKSSLSLFKTITTQSPDLIFYNSPLVREQLNSLAEIYIKYTDNYAEPQHLNIERQPVQNIILHNFIGIVTKSLNISKTFDDFVKKIPQLNPNSEGNSWLSYSQILSPNSLFFKDGKLTKPLSIEIIEGSEVRESSEGTPTSKLSLADRIAQEFALNLQGLYYILTPADTKTEWGINFGHFVSQSQVKDNTYILNIFKNYLKAEIATVQQGNTQNLKNIQKAVGKLRFFQDILGFELVIDNTKTPDKIVSENEAQINEAILNWIETNTQETLTEFRNNNIIVPYKEQESEDGFVPVGKAGNLFTILFAPKNYIGEGLTESEIKDLVKFANINYMFNIFEQHKLFWGDPAQWKDITKRTKSFVSGRNLSVTDATYFNEFNNKKLNTLSYIDDNGNPQTIELQPGDFGYSHYNDKIRTQTYSDVEVVNENLPGYDNINEADAQGWAFPLGYREIRQRANTWTEADQEQFEWDNALCRKDNNLYPKGKRGKELRKYDNYIISKGNPYLNRAKEGKELPSNYVLKPIYSGFKDGNTATINLDKLSLAPLNWRTVKGTNAEKFYLEHFKKNTTYIKVNSAQKVGEKTNTQPLYDKNGNLNLNIQHEELSFKYFGIQVETKTQKTKTTLGTQLTKLINIGLSILNPKHKTLIDKNNSLLSAMKVMSKNQIFTEFGIIEKKINGKDVFEFTNFEALEQLIQRELNNRDATENLKLALKVNPSTGRFYLPFDLVIGSDKLEALITSIIDNNILRPKMFGGQMPQISSTLFEKNPRIYSKKSSKTGKQYLVSNELKFYEDKDGKRHCEVYLPFYMQEYISQGKELNINDLPEDLKFGVGFRIPTQNTNSIENFKIKGFLPVEYGNSIVVPSEITTKAGSDFDIDKLNIYLYNYYINLKTGKPEKIKFLDNSNSTTEERYENYKRKNPKIKEIYKEFSEKIEAVNKSLQKSWEIQTGQLNKLIEQKQFTEKQLEDLFYAKREKEIQLAFEKSDVKETNLLLRELEKGYEEDPVSTQLLAEISGFKGDAFSNLNQVALELEENQNKVLATEAQLEVIQNKIKTLSIDKLKKSDIQEKVNKRIKRQEEYITQRDELLKERTEEINKLTPDITFEEFSKLPIELQNSRKAVENAYIDNIREILELPEMFQQLIKPNSAEELKQQAKQINNLWGVNKEQKASNYYLSRINNAKDRHSFLVGKDAVGIGASQQTQNAIGQIIGLSFTDKIGGKFNFNFPTNSTQNGDVITYSLAERIDKAGKSISDTISMFIDAFVDIAKDPYIFDLNGNLDTASIYITGVRMGIPLPLLTRWFNQPVVREYITLLQQNKSISTDLQQNKVFKSVLAGRALSKFKAQESERTKDFTESELDNYIKEYVENPTETSQEFKDAQYHLLQQFRALEDVSWSLFRFGRAINLDTSRTVSFESIRIKMANVLAGINDPLFGTFVKKALKQTFIGSIYDTKKQLLESIKPLYLSESDKARVVLNPLLNKIYNSIGKQLTLEEEAKKLRKHFITYLIHTIPFQFGNNTQPVYLTSYIDNLLLSDNNIATRLRALQAAQQEQKLPDNFFTKNMFGIIPAFVQKQFQKTKNVRLARKIQEKIEKDLITSDFRNLTNHPLTEPILHDFVRTALLQSGLNVDPFSFAEYIPNEIFQEIANQINAYFENADITELLKNFQNSYYQNQWYNQNIVPKASLKKTTIDKETGNYKERIVNWRLKTKDNKSISIPFLEYFVESDTSERPIFSKEARNPYLIVTQIKKDVDGTDMYSKFEREQMAKKGDFSFLERTLYKRLELFNPETNQIDIPLSKKYYFTDKKTGLDVNGYIILYYPVNAYGERFNLVEHYSYNAPSKINTYRGNMTDEKVYEILKLNNKMSDRFVFQHIFPNLAQEQEDFITNLDEMLTQDIAEIQIEEQPQIKEIPTQEVIKPGVQELFESNPTLANAVYSKILTNSGLSAENLLSLLLKDNLIEKQCS